MRGLWRLVAILVVSAVVASSGCSTASHDPTITTAPGARARWTRPLHAVTEPLVVDGVLLVLVSTSSRGLDLVGLDPGTGATRWTVHSAFSDTTAGVVPGLGGIRGQVYVFVKPLRASATGKRGEVSIADVDILTGAVVWTSAPGFFSEWPTVCADDFQEICTTGYSSVERATPSEELRYNARNGRYEGSTTVPGTQFGRAIGDALFDTGSRSPETLAALSGTKPRWKRPLSAIFPGRGYSTDNGWGIDLVQHRTLYVGSIGTPVVQVSLGRYVYDYSRAETVGFRASDGAPVWLDRGSNYRCGIFPCPGQHGALGSSQPPAVGIRYRARGTVTSGPHLPVQVSRNASLTIEGFDLATGKTTWSYDAGRALGLLQGGTPPLLASPWVVVPSPSGPPVELDVGDGHTKPVPSDLVAWCTKPNSYQGLSHLTAAKLPSTSYAGAQSQVACNAEGKAVPTPPAAPGFIGAASSGRVAWIGEGQIISEPESH